MVLKIVLCIFSFAGCFRVRVLGFSSLSERGGLRADEDGDV